MKQKTSLFTCVGICAISMFIYSHLTGQDANSSLLLANIEALSETEVEMQDCTRILVSGSCYNKETGEWCGMYIDAVEQ